MDMRRVFYVGQESVLDARLGLDLHPGYAFDCPAHIAEALLREPCFRETRGGSLVEDKPRPEITWYTAPPGEELLALDGIGPARAASLVKLGIQHLDNLLDLDDEGQARLAQSLPGVDIEQVNAWVDQARTIKEAM